MKDKDYLINKGVDVEKSLELFGDIKTYNETLEEFLSSVKEKTDNLEKFKEASDMYNYAIVAHSLKSDARYLGFTKLAELSLEHEMAGKENNVSFVYDNIEALMNEVDRILTVINEYKGEEVINVIKPIQKALDKVILVADDSDIVRNYVKKMFEDQYEIKMATNGNEAINIIKSDLGQKIVCLLLDLNMPEVDGFAVLDYFDKMNLFVRIPVAIITGAEDKNDISKAFMYPIVDVLNKPFNEKNVKNVLDRMLLK